MTDDAKLREAAEVEAVKWNACCAALRAAILRYIKNNFTTATAKAPERELLEMAEIFYKDAGKNLLDRLAAAEAKADELREELHDIIMLDAEYNALNGGGPGWSKRWDTAMRKSGERFEP